MVQTMLAAAMWKLRIIILLYFVVTEAVVQKNSANKVFLEISQNSQQNTCTRVSFQ